MLGANQCNTVSGKQKKTTAKGKEGTSSSESTSTSESEITLDTAANAWQARKDQYDRETPDLTTTLLKTVLNQGASAHDCKRELNSEEKAHRVLKETTGHNSSTITAASMVSPAPCPSSSSQAPPQSAWIFDSGTSAHMCNHPGQFETLQTHSRHVRGFNGSRSLITGIGTFRLGCHICG